MDCDTYCKKSRNATEDELLNAHTGPSMKFDIIHSKEAIVMWPDMHSF